MTALLGVVRAASFCGLPLVPPSSLFGYPPGGAVRQRAPIPPEGQRSYRKRGGQSLRSSAAARGKSLKFKWLPPGALGALKLYYARRCRSPDVGIASRNSAVGRYVGRDLRCFTVHELTAALPTNHWTKSRYYAAQVRETHLASPSEGSADRANSNKNGGHASL